MKEGKFFVGEGDKRAEMKMPPRTKSEQHQKDLAITRDLHTVFGTKDDPNMNELLASQMQEIHALLKKDGLVEWPDAKAVAPGLAMLGGELALSGFGRYGEDSEKEISDGEDKAYRAAKTVFDQVLRKIYPDGPSSKMLSHLLEDTPDVATMFEKVRKPLTSLDQQGLLELQNDIDHLIQVYGSEMLDSVEQYAPLRGKLSEDAEENQFGRMHRNALLLAELQRLKYDAVKRQFGTGGAYADMSPTQLRKLQKAHSKANEAMKG